jgi:hypothetical protein
MVFTVSSNATAVASSTIADVSLLETMLGRFHR